jgi:uncharacterized protein YkwD
MPRRLWLPVLPVLLVLGLTSTPAANAESSRAVAQAGLPSMSTLTTTQFENRLVYRTNNRRQRIGCPALRINSSLTAAARTHSARMVSSGDFSHQTPGEPYFSTRISRAGYTGWSTLAENIAWASNASPSEIFSMWIGSAPHRENIDNCTFRDVGVGVVYSKGVAWVTMDLGRR